MANERPKEDNTVSLGNNISLDQLISATSTSVLRALKEHERLEPNNRFDFNPRIWVGIWVDLDRFRFPGGPTGGPGGGPVAGGGLGG